MTTRSGLVPILASAVLLFTALPAQSNGVTGMDVSLSRLDTVATMGRTGTYPDGLNGCALSTTSCNVGTVNIPWYTPMNEQHPFIGFLIVREADGRFEQISDYSFVKHGFLATNSPGCGTCQSPGTSSLLGRNCTDTYGTGNNGDRYYLGPASEINPWLGTWTARGSHFDRGEPDVGAPQNNDGIRSLTSTMTNAMGPVRHRVVVADQDFLTPNALFYTQAHYVIGSEFEYLRNDNLGYRRFTATWSGSRWNLTVNTNLTNGSVLQAWQGATLSSNTNGGDDGRFFVAVRVSGPVNGLYTYRYAIHNRDNHRGGGILRIPVCPDARVLNATFRDIDDIAANNWSITRNPAEILFTAPAGNALRWNSIYNFEFESDAAPLEGVVHIDQADPGVGAATVTVAARVPQALNNQNLGDGCGTPDLPILHAGGNPAKATLGNASFALTLGNLAPLSACALLLGSTPGQFALGSGCTLYMDPLGIAITLSGTASAAGTHDLPLPIPVNLSLEGQSLVFQGIELQPGTGAYLGQVDFSNGLKVRIGNTISGCP